VRRRQRALPLGAEGIGRTRALPAAPRPFATHHSSDAATRAIAIAIASGSVIAAEKELIRRLDAHRAGE
jgi:hypothetical protein